MRDQGWGAGLLRRETMATNITGYVQNIIYIFKVFIILILLNRFFRGRGGWGFVRIFNVCLYNQQEKNSRTKEKNNDWNSQR